MIEDRYKTSSTIITRQLATDQWHAAIGDATVADSICDRLVHNAHRIQLRGESIRKSNALTTGKKPTKERSPASSAAGSGCSASPEYAPHQGRFHFGQRGHWQLI